MCECVTFLTADYSSATTSSPYAWPSVVMVTSSWGWDRTTTESAEPGGRDINTKPRSKRTKHLVTWELPYSQAHSQCPILHYFTFVLEVSINFHLVFYSLVLMSVDRRSKEKKPCYTESIKSNQSLGEVNTLNTHKQHTDPESDTLSCMFLMWQDSLTLYQHLPLQLSGSK